MYLGHRLSALLQLHLHSRVNTWLQWIGHRQLQDETRNIKVLEFGAPYVSDFTAYALPTSQKYVINDIYPLFIASSNKAAAFL